MKGTKKPVINRALPGNESLLNWINDEIKSLADEQFFHKAYEATLADTSTLISYGSCRSWCFCSSFISGRPGYCA